MSNINVLVEAKNEYIDKLTRVISPIAIEIMLTLYNDAHELTKGHQQLTQYQKLLQEVKSWNESIINDNTQKICETCNYFRDIVTAVFICYTKIMSSIRLGTVKKSISLKIPSNEIFVHAVLKDLADSLYNDPFFLQEASNFEIKKNMTGRIKVSVETAVKTLSPLDQILKTYVSSGEEFEMEESGEDTDPDIDSDMEEEELTSDMKEEGNPTSEIQEEEGNPTSDIPEEEGNPTNEIPVEDDSKTISFKGDEPEQENLFDDAPMEKNMR